MSFYASNSESRAKVFRLAGGVFYGWWLVGIAGFMLTLMSVSVFQGLGTMLVGLERHFGWSRTAMSGAFALARAEGAVLGPIEGYLIDRFGSRRLVLIGYIIMGIGFLMFSRVDALWQFYVAFLVITLGGGLGGWLANISLINNWFVRRRSFAMAAAMSGVHLGGFLVPVLAFGIDSHGFRWVTLGIGVFFLAIIGPVVKVIRNRPEDYGMRPDGAPMAEVQPDLIEAAPEPEAEPDFTAAQALKTPVFYIITVAHMSSSVSIVTLALHLVPKLTDIGFSLGAAGVVVLTYTAVAMPAQFMAGYVADRLPKPPVIFAFLLLQSVAIMVIAVAESAPMVYLFAVLFGIGFGGRIPLLTAIRGEYFGRKAFATIMGISQLPSSVVMIFAPLFAGYMFDTTGSYTVPFTTFAIFGFLGAFLMLFVRRPSAVSFSTTR
jgi:MFS family permease